MDDAEIARRVAYQWAARTGGRVDWRELWAVAWEGLTRRAASRSARGLPAMDQKQRWLAARSAIADELRLTQGGFSGGRGGGPARLVPFSVVEGGESPWVEAVAPTVFVPAEPPSGRHRRHWTAAEDRALRKAIGRVSGPEIGRGLGRTERGVWHRCAVLGIGPGRGVRPDEARRSELVAYLGQGLSLSAAGRVMGVGPEAVWKLAQRLVAAGRLARTGGRSQACRYVPVNSSQATANQP